jgi:hypothetical protein
MHDELEAALPQCSQALQRASLREDFSRAHEWQPVRHGVDAGRLGKVLARNKHLQRVASRVLRLSVSLSARRSANDDSTGVVDECARLKVHSHPTSSYAILDLVFNKDRPSCGDRSSQEIHYFHHVRIRCAKDD